MTKRTSSPSAKATPKTEEEPVSNGTPLIDPSFETISEDVKLLEKTEWTLRFADNSIRVIRVKGGRGRISFSNNRGVGSGEVRVYRNESTKTFDAVFTNVLEVTSDRIEEVATTTSVKVKASHSGGKASNPVGGVVSSWSTPSGAWAYVEAEPAIPLNPEDYLKKETEF